MSEVIGKLNVDFDIIQSTTRTLWIGDKSDWVYAEQLPANIYIKLPGSSKNLEFVFVKKQINAFNSHNLGISCQNDDCADESYVDLKDGIYTINLKSSFTDFDKTKYYLKTDKIELEIAKEIVKNGFEYSKDDKKFRDVIYDIDWLIKVAKSHAKIGDFVRAGNYYQEAKGLYKKLFY